MEYATREDAQNAVNTLSNQQLMGRLVYVREVCMDPCVNAKPKLSTGAIQDREAEPKFSGAAPPPRGGYAGGMQGGFAGGYGAPVGRPQAAQIYVSNVCFPTPTLIADSFKASFVY